MSNAEQKLSDVYFVCGRCGDEELIIDAGTDGSKAKQNAMSFLGELHLLDELVDADQTPKGDWEITEPFKLPKAFMSSDGFLFVFDGKEWTDGDLSFDSLNGVPVDELGDPLDGRPHDNFLDAHYMDIVKRVFLLTLDAKEEA